MTQLSRHLPGLPKQARITVSPLTRIQRDGGYARSGLSDRHKFVSKRTRKPTKVAHEKQVIQAAARPRPLVLIHVDGLSHPRLLTGIASGHMPFVGRLIASGGYEALPYRCGVPWSRKSGNSISSM